jgi:flagellar assembly factor FliW
MDLSPSTPVEPGPGVRAAGPTQGPTSEPSPAPPVGEDLGPLLLPAGLPGFPELRTCRLGRLAGAGAFALLEAEAPAGPRFVVMPVGEPGAVLGAAAVAEAAAALGTAEADLLFLLIVTLAGTPGGREAFVNLRAPLVVDTARRTARQLVLADPRLPLRQPLEARRAA